MENANVTGRPVMHDGVEDVRASGSHGRAELRPLVFAAMVVASAALGGFFLPRVSSVSRVLGGPASVSSVPSVPSTPARMIAFAAQADAPNATLAFRSRTVALPVREAIAASDTPELVEVSAPGHEGRRYWIKISEPRDFRASLPPGSGVADATYDETVKALTGEGEDGDAAGSNPGSATVPPSAASKIAGTVAAAAFPARSPSSGGGAMVAFGTQRQRHPAGQPGSESTGSSAVAVTVPNTPASPSPGSVPASSSNAVAPSSLGGIGTGGIGGTGGANVANANSSGGVGSSASVGGGAAPAPGTVDAKAVKVTVRAHASEVQACFTRAQMEKQGIEGRVSVGATVSPSGDVVSANVTNSTVSNARLESCVVSAFRTWHFPAPAGGINGQVSYTFVFQ